MASRDAFDADDSLPYLIVRLGHRLSHAFTELMGSVGLSARQFGMLTEVAKDDGIGSAELARRMGITPQSAGDQVEVMVERGLFRRDSPGSGRKAGIHLTRKGHSTLKKALGLAIEYDARLTGHFGRSALTQIMADLEEMGRRI